MHTNRVSEFPVSPSVIGSTHPSIQHPIHPPVHPSKGPFIKRHPSAQTCARPQATHAEGAHGQHGCAPPRGRSAPAPGRRGRGPGHQGHAVARGEGGAEPVAGQPAGAGEGDEGGPEDERAAGHCWATAGAADRCGPRVARNVCRSPPQTCHAFCKTKCACVVSLLPECVCAVTKMKMCGVRCKINIVSRSLQLKIPLTKKQKIHPKKKKPSLIDWAYCWECQRGAYLRNGMGHGSDCEQASFKNSGGAGDPPRNRAA